MISLLVCGPIVFFLSFGALIFCLTIHEFSHALMADKLGDPTPRIQGRLTLNPLSHLDPIGTIAMLLTGFGWGKPVQFDPYNLKNPLRDSALIALAGPASNLIIAALFSIILNLNIVPIFLLKEAITEVVIVNTVLATFNLVPVHPLDGSKIILAILPRGLAYEYELFMHQYGLFVLFALILPWYNGQSPLQFLIQPIIRVIGILFLGSQFFFNLPC